MTLFQQITQDMQKALVGRDEFLLGTLRMAIAELKNKKIELSGAKEQDLTDEEVVAVLQKEMKKRDEAIVLYRQGGRPELADKEEKEKQFLSKYLPQPMGAEELTKIISKIVKDSGAQGPADFGKVMGLVMSRLKGSADGQIVAEIVKKVLAK